MEERIADVVLPAFRADRHKFMTAGAPPHAVSCACLFPAACMLVCERSGQSCLPVTDAADLKRAVKVVAMRRAVADQHAQQQRYIGYNMSASA